MEDVRVLARQPLRVERGPLAHAEAVLLVDNDVRARELYGVLDQGVRADDQRQLPEDSFASRSARRPASTPVSRPIGTTEPGISDWIVAKCCSAVSVGPCRSAWRSCSTARSIA